MASQKHIDEEDQKMEDISDKRKHFVTEFKKEFEAKYNSYFEEATGKTSKAGKSSTVSTTIVTAVSSLIPGAKPFGKGTNEVINYGEKKKHKVKAEAATRVLCDNSKDKLTEKIVHAGVDIFYHMEYQFTQINYQGGWKVAFSIIATDLVERIMDFIHTARETSPHSEFELSDQLITTWALGGFSKPEAANIVPLLENDIVWIARGLPDKVGVFVDDKFGRKYYSRNGNNIKKYGCRRLFPWETNIPNNYTRAEYSLPKYNYLLKAEDLPDVKTELLNEIKISENKAEHKLDLLLDAQLPPIKFDVRHHIPLFTGRNKLLEQLHSFLIQSESGKVLITQDSRSGAQNLGKTELVRKYFADRTGEYYKKNCIWLNSPNWYSLTESLRGLIDQHFPNEILPRNIKGCFKDVDEMLEEVCNHVRESRPKSKTLFVFDNVIKNEEDPVDYETIFRKLDPPSSYTIVTSRIQSWTSITPSLNNSEIIKVGVFSSYEAESFIENSLDGVLGLQSSQNMKQLAEQFNYEPHAIKEILRKIITGYRTQNLKAQTIADVISQLKISVPQMTSKDEPMDVDIIETPVVTQVLPPVKITRANRNSKDRVKESPREVKLSAVNNNPKNKSLQTSSDVREVTNRRWHLLRLEDKEPIGVLHLLPFISPSRFIEVSFFSKIFSPDKVEADLVRLETCPYEFTFEYDDDNKDKVKVSVSHDAQVHYRPKMVATFEQSLLKIVSFLKQEIFAKCGKSPPQEGDMLSDYLAHFFSAWWFTAKNPVFLEKTKEDPVHIVEKLRDSKRLYEGMIFGSSMCLKLTKIFGETDETTRRVKLCTDNILKERNILISAISTPGETVLHLEASTSPRKRKHDDEDEDTAPVKITKE